MARAQEFDWVGCLPEDVRTALLAETVKVAMPAGTMLYERNAPATGVYRLKQGRVRQFFLTASGREHVAKICDPVETVGDLAAIDGKPRMLFSQTVTDCDFEFLPIEKLPRLRAKYRAIDEALVVHLASALRMAMQFIEEATTFDLPMRVASRLYWLSFETPSATNDEIDVRISQGELALMVGASRQAINRALGDLQKCGAIRISYGSIAITDRRRLKEFIAQAGDAAARD